MPQNKTPDKALTDVCKATQDGRMKGWFMGMKNKSFESELKDVLNLLISNYYCNCPEARIGKVGKDVRYHIQAIKQLIKKYALKSNKIKDPIYDQWEIGWNNYKTQLFKNLGIEEE